MEQLIYKVWATMLTITMQPNCPAEDGLYCTTYSVNRIEVYSSASREHALGAFNNIKALTQADTLIRHVRYLQVPLRAELDSVPKPKQGE